MDYSLSALERAFQLAATGAFSNIAEIRNALSAEGYNASQVEGPALSKQLMAIINAKHIPTPD